MEILLAETHRIQRHLESAEARARGRHGQRWTLLQHAVRALLLDELAAYSAAGLFPTNADFAEPMPYFIDASGTRCAMAHLMEIGGGAALVAEIAATRNNAFIAELADDPRVVAWLEAAGLTVAEAAYIQPSYCASAPSACVCNAATAQPSLFVRGKSGQEEGTLIVLEVSGTGTGACASVSVGDSIDLFYTHPGDTREYMAVATPVPASIDQPGRCSGRTVFTLENGAASCRSLADVALPSALSLAETASLLSSGECGSRLDGKGAAWSEEPDCGSDTFGCSSAPRGSAASSAVLPLTGVVLAAVLAYRAARLRSRRRP